jgi:hypothetical protein
MEGQEGEGKARNASKQLRSGIIMEAMALNSICASKQCVLGLMKSGSGCGCNAAVNAETHDK